MAATVIKMGRKRKVVASTARILRGELGRYAVSSQAPEEIQELERTTAGMADDSHRLHDKRTLLLTGISHELRTPRVGSGR